MKKKKIIIGSVIGLMLLVGTIGALDPTETPQQPKQPETTRHPSSDSDEPTVLVKDPETGETKAVTPNEIKDNPQLAQQITHNPTPQDYQSANVTDPRTYPDVDPPKPYQMPVDPVDTYVSSSYMKDLWLNDGTCSSELAYPAGYQERFKASDPQPNTVLDSNCKKYVLVSTDIEYDYRYEYTVENGNQIVKVEVPINIYRHHWYKKNQQNHPYRIAVCTVNGTAHYKEVASGDPCDLYKSNHNGWSTNKL